MPYDCFDSALASESLLRSFDQPSHVRLQGSHSNVSLTPVPLPKSSSSTYMQTHNHTPHQGPEKAVRAVPVFNLHKPRTKWLAQNPPV